MNVKNVNVNVKMIKKRRLEEVVDKNLVAYTNPSTDNDSKFLWLSPRLSTEWFSLLLMVCFMLYLGVFSSVD